MSSSLIAQRDSDAFASVPPLCVTHWVQDTASLTQQSSILKDTLNVSTSYEEPLSEAAKDDQAVILLQVLLFALAKTGAASKNRIQSGSACPRVVSFNGALS